MKWTDPELVKALLSSADGLLTIITAISTTISAIVLARHNRMKEKLVLAQQDIATLLQIEDEHCQLHLQTIGESYKKRIRQKVFAAGFKWSAKFTPGRVRGRATGPDTSASLIWQMLARFKRGSKAPEARPSERV